MTLKSGSMWVTHNSDGTKTISVSANLKTDTQGTSWALPYVSLSGNYTLPLIARMPSAPGKPVVTTDPATGRMTATVSPATPNGVPITGYTYRIWEKRYGESTWVLATQYPADSNRQVRFDPNQPLNQVVFEACADTAYGSGPYGESSSVTAIGSGPKLKVAGVWKTTNAFMKIDGVWRPVWCHVRNSGLWKRINK